MSKGSDYVEYVYLANGEKLAKKKNGQFVNFYCGSFVYKSDKSLEYISHGEGLALKNGSLFDYQYNLTDHLGNVRNVLNASATSIQSNDYYPFGLTHNTVSNFAKNKYLYNGKEAQDETIGGTIYNVLDYHARSYDPVIGRMTEPDPMTEKYASISPFAYAANNPIFFIDPNGEEIYIYYEDEDGNEQKHLFDPNVGYDGSNVFIKAVYESYSYMKDNGIDMNPFDIFIGDENSHVNIYHADKNPVPREKGRDGISINEEYDINSNKEQSVADIYWGHENAMEFTTKENNKKVTGYHPPSLGLLHEMGHAYKTKQLGGKESVKELNTEPKKKDWHWRSEQEKWIIENIESPAAKILGLKQRYTYNGTTYKTDGVNSIVPKENPKNKKLKK